MAAEGTISGEVDQRKPRRTYTPSPWGKFFLNYSPCTRSQYMEMKDMARVEKENVRKIILDVVGASSADLAPKLELVDTLQRAGVAYHYCEEIDEILCDVHDNEDARECDDLHIASLRFYLLRKHGYHISPDVFLKFRDDQGNFASNDVKSLLALYDAAHIRVHGEEILDGAINFTKTHLRSIVEHIEPLLAEEVRCTLETPCFRRVERFEVRRYISVHEKKATRYQTILEFAKLEFNILQTMYCEELKALTTWWEDFKSRTDLRFARDRIVEIHFWMLGVLYEPQHSCSRIMITKLVMFVSLFDDLFDNYSTTEESNMFTRDMERWEKQPTEDFPSYLKAIYVNIFNTTDGIVEELKRQKNKNADLVRKLVIDIVKSYHAEVKWRDEHYVPSSVEEHLEISVRSSACMHIISNIFIMLGDTTTTEALEWVYTYPNIIRGVCIIGRIGNDMVSHEREQGSEHVTSTVQTCMKEHGITTKEANEKLKVVIEEAWMDIVTEYLEKKHPIFLLGKAVDLARTMDFMYKREDAYTLSYSLKDSIDSMFVEFL